MFKPSSCLLPLLAVLTAAPALAAGGNCNPAKPYAIERFPFWKTGSTAGLTSSRKWYLSALCPLPDEYEGGEVRYRIRLHRDGQFGFRVVPQSTGTAQAPDLVLVLLDDEDACVASSVDLLGSQPEEIAPQRLSKGEYVLVVDSIDLARGGPFTVHATGTNPLPDVAPIVEVGGDVVAGAAQGYTLSLSASNTGELAASNVVVQATLPEGISLKGSLPEGCWGVNEAVKCALGTVAAGGRSAFKEIPLRVGPGVRGTLEHTASVTSCEEDFNSGNDQAAKSLGVQAQADLKVMKLLGTRPSGQPGGLVAGENIMYTVRAHNGGPSTANGVVLTLDPPNKVCDKRDSACESAGIATWQIGRLKPGESVEKTVEYRINPRARNRLRATASVRATDPDGSGSVELLSRVSAEVQLAIQGTSSAAPTCPVSQGVQRGEVVAGCELTYTFTVSNSGRSTATGVTVTGQLPAGTTLSGPRNACEVRSGLVTCAVPDIDPDESSMVAYTVKVDAGKRETVEHQASARSAEMPMGSSVMSAKLTTAVLVRADLALVGAVTPGPVAAGAPLAYKFTVTNHGPSESSPGTVEVPLENVAFLSSPDSCSITRGTVTCEVPALDPDTGTSEILRFAARVDESLDPTPSLGATATVSGGSGEDFNDTNDSATVGVQVLRVADLAVSLAEEGSDPVGPGQCVQYQATITNRGPSFSAGDSILTFCLPEAFGLEPASESAVCPGPALSEGCRVVTPPNACSSDLHEVRCDLREDLLPGAQVVQGLVVAAPSALDHYTTTVKLEQLDRQRDPDATNNMASARTTVTDTDHTDLAVTLAASAGPVIVGDPLTLTLRVKNRGFADLDENAAAATLSLPPELNIDPAQEGNCTTSEGEGGGIVLRCPVPALHSGEYIEREIKARVEGRKPADERFELIARAGASELEGDPNLGNNSFTLPLTVLAVASLVLPYFNATPAAPTLFAVRNEGSEGLGVDYAFLPGEGGPLCPDRPYPPNLEPQETFTAKLPDGCFPGSQRGSVGALAISVVNSSSGELLPGLRPLSGDFFQISEQGREASGGQLLRTTSAGAVPGLCRRWDVPLAHRGPTKAQTDYTFFVPSGSCDTECTAVGRVYSEAGELVQEVVVALPQGAVAFEHTSEALDILTHAGAIEWEFPPGVVGSISATLRTEGGLAVNLPGFCRDRTAPTKELILPHFEVAPGPAGRTTLLTLHNGADEAIEVCLDLCPAEGDCPESITRSLQLMAHATQTINLRRRFPQLTSQQHGYVRIRPATRPDGSFRALSGSYVRIAEKDGAPLWAAGEALVRKESDLCREWSVRFLDGTASTSTTEFVFFVAAGNPTNVTGTVFGLDGEEQGQPIQGRAPSRSFTVAIGTLRPGVRPGTVVWDLGQGVLGHVSSLHRNGSQAVLVAGTCLDGLTDP